MSKLKLADVFGVASTKLVRIAGRDWTLRQIDFDDEAMLDSIAPRPEAPMAKPENAGSLAPPVPVLNDPGYRAKHVAWYRTRLTLEAGIAACIVTDDDVAWSSSDVAAAEKWAGLVGPALRKLPLAVLEQIVFEARRIGEVGPDEAVEKLIRPAPAGATTPKQLTPDLYITTELFQMLRVCERFGINPVDGVIGLQRAGSGVLQILALYDRVRQEQERPIPIGVAPETFPSGQSHEPG